MQEKALWIGAAGVFLAVLFLFWSAVLTLQLGRSIQDVLPWTVVEFIAVYGVDGRPGALLRHSFVWALLLTVAVALPVFFLRRPTWYGDARWARPGELRTAQLRADDGVVLGKKNGKLLRNNEPIHALVAAPTRSGKGVGVVIPNLLYWNGSVVVLDIKKENYALTAGHRRKYHPVYLWAPMDAHSHTYNPLDFISHEATRRITELQKLATILVPHAGHGERMWVEEARQLFIGLTLLVLDDKQVPHTIGQVYRTLMSETDLAQVITLALDDRERTLDPICRRLLASFKNKADKERSGVKSNLTSALGLWSNPRIDAATAGSDFDLREFRRKRAAVYVGVGQDQLQTLAPLLNLFFQQAVATLSQAKPGQDEPHEVLFLIDEFAMLGDMPTLATGLALLAGYGIRVIVIVQGLGQLEHIYNKGGTEDILQNCALQIFFASNDDRTTHYVSDRLGTKTVKVHSRQQGQDWSTMTTTSYTGLPLLPPEEVRRLDPQQAIIFKEAARPGLAKKIRYYADNMFANRVIDPPSVPALAIPRPPLDRGEQAVAALEKLLDEDTPTKEPGNGAAASDFADVYAAFREDMPTERSEA